MKLKKAFERLSDERKTKLIETAKDLYLTLPYDQVTTRLLNEKLKINPATFYRYFDSKDDLFIYIYTKIIRDSNMTDDTASVLDKLPPETDYMSEKDYEFIKLAFTIPEPVLYKLYFEEDYLNDCLEFNRKTLLKERSEGYTKDNIDIDYLAWHMCQSQYYALLYYRNTNQVFDRESFDKLMNYVRIDLPRHGYYK